MERKVRAEINEIETKRMKQTIRQRTGSLKR
jgi:hypothetical protein